ncbi:MAG TPA: CBASS cGAMP-activated phospholipase [Candidatus Binataceae bacterium]|nr:CBASS cGAMP-activated phospholipase [Candidatus Binataceae bacterium]
MGADQPIPSAAAPTTARFSILALDGGGARGYLSVKILEHVEAHLNALTREDLPLGARFDLIAGTSTGGIAALALALGLTAHEVSALYETHIPQIFGPAMRRFRWTDSFRPRYRTAALRRALQAFFAGRMLGDVQTDVCVTAVSLVNAQPRVFRSNYVKSGISRNDETLADLAMATSAAPTFFEAHSTQHMTDLVDGSLCASNPTLVGLVEAFRFSRPSRRGISPPHDLGALCLYHLAVLSVGTGEQCAMPYDLDHLRTAGTLAWGAHFHDVSMESQTQLVHLLSKGLLGGAYRRINPRLDFPMAIDNIRKIAALKNLSELSEDDEAFLRAYFTPPWEGDSSLSVESPAATVLEDAPRKLMAGCLGRDLVGMSTLY